MTTSSCVSGQTPFGRVQRKTFAPTLKPVTVVVAELAFEMVADPETSVQKPGLFTIAFPARVADVPHTN